MSADFVQKKDKERAPTDGTSDFGSVSKMGTGNENLQGVPYDSKQQSQQVGQGDKVGVVGFTANTPPSTDELQIDPEVVELASCYEVSTIERAVMRNASSRFSSLANAMGFTLDEVSRLTETIPQEDKLLNIYWKLSQIAGQKAAILRLLMACKQIEPSVLGAVKDTLTVHPAQPSEPGIALPDQPEEEQSSLHYIEEEESDEEVYHSAEEEMQPEPKTLICSDVFPSARGTWNTISPNQQWVYTLGNVKNLEKSPNVFKLVMILLDDTELGLVAKPVLVQSEILRLCSILAPNDVRPDMKASEICLKSLMQYQIKAVGLYGDENALVRFLQEECGFGEDIRAMATSFNEYPRGLYALLGDNNTVFIVFLRSSPLRPGLKDKQATRFFAYLRDVCTEIYVLLNSHQLEWLSNEDYKTDVNIEDGSKQYKLPGAFTPFKSSAEESFNVTSGVCCILPTTFDTSANAEMIVSSGHEGFAVYQPSSKRVHYLQLPYAKDSLRLGNPNNVTEPIFVQCPEKLNVGDEEKVVSLSCIASSSVRHILCATVLERSGRMFVRGGRIVQPTTVERRFPKSIPAAVGYNETKVAWYDRNSNSIYICEVEEYIKVVIEERLPLPEQARSRAVKFLEFLSEDNILFIDDIGKGRIIEISTSEIRPGNYNCNIDGFELVDVCPLQQGKDWNKWIAFAYARKPKDSTVTVKLYEFAGGSLSPIMAVQLGQLPASITNKVKLVNKHRDLHVLVVDVSTRRLLGGKITIGVEEKKPTCDTLTRNGLPTDLFRYLFREHPVQHCCQADKDVKQLKLSFPVYEFPTELWLDLRTQLEKRIKSHLESARIGYHQPVEKLNLQVEVFSAKKTASRLECIVKVPLGHCLVDMLSVVPIQVARPENRNLIPLVNGIEVVQVCRTEAPEAIASAISFGFVEALFRYADNSFLPVKVVSAQGKQSVGKSFFLNHLAGVHFDTAGWRCTEGVWMCAKLLPDCLLVLLDFEGRHTGERTIQEDCLAAIFAAAVSTVVIQKQDTQILREEKALYEAMKEAALRIGAIDTRQPLFNAMLCVVLKDVKDDHQDSIDGITSDVRGLLQGVIQMYSSGKPKSNKVQAEGLYRDICFYCQNPLGDKTYSRTISAVFQVILNETQKSLSASTSLTLMKKILADLYSSRHTVNFDSTTLTLQEDAIREQLPTALQRGTLKTNRLETDFTLSTSTDRMSVVPDITDTEYLPVDDTGLELCTFDDERRTAKMTVREKTFIETLDIFRRKNGEHVRDENDSGWIRDLQTFFDSLVQRRITRVLKWVENSLPSEGALSRKLKLRKAHFLASLRDGYFVRLRNLWMLCAFKCQQQTGNHGVCERRCTKLKHLCLDCGGCEQCNCQESEHHCNRPCDLCSQTSVQNGNQQCALGACHSGRHVCSRPVHPCDKKCKLFGSRYCKDSCSGTLEQPHSEHLCSIGADHKCVHNCSANNCKALCNLPFRHETFVLGEKTHDCGAKICLSSCIVPGCGDPCREQNDHFHGFKSHTHLCLKKQHKCIERNCTVPGGKCPAADWETEKRRCVVTIYYGKSSHSGPHFCGDIHRCKEKCPCGCNQLCVREMNKDSDVDSASINFFSPHTGLCETEDHPFSNGGLDVLSDIQTFMEKNSKCVIEFGALAIKDGDVICSLPDECDRVSVSSDFVKPLSTLKDSGLQLCRWNDTESSATVDLEIPVVNAFRKDFFRETDERTWVDLFVKFCRCVIDRRVSRAMLWLDNTYPKDDKISPDLRESIRNLKEKWHATFCLPLQKQWTICNAVCKKRSATGEQCNRRCIVIKGSCGEDDCCDCLEKDHRCSQFCDLCESDAEYELQRCRYGSMHEGRHICLTSTHLCEKECMFHEAENCQIKCIVTRGTNHKDHICRVAPKQHKCSGTCVAPGCTRKCNLGYGHDDSLQANEVRHLCTETQCATTCDVSQCKERCEGSHVHGIDTPLSVHLCSLEGHRCLDLCSSDLAGRCEGKDHSRRVCNVKILKQQTQHSGPHYCGGDHLCNQKCRCCQSYCIKTLIKRETANGSPVFSSTVTFAQQECTCLPTSMMTCFKK